MWNPLQKRGHWPPNAHVGKSCRITDGSRLGWFQLAWGPTRLMWAWVKLCCVLSSPSASLVCGFTNYSEEENASSKIIALHIGINQDFFLGQAYKYQNWVYIRFDDANAFSFSPVSFARSDAMSRIRLFESFVSLILDLCVDSYSQPECVHRVRWMFRITCLKQCMSSNVDFW